MPDIVLISDKCNKRTNPFALLGPVGLVLRPCAAGYSQRILSYGCPQRWYSGLSPNTLLLNHLTALHAVHSSSLQMSNTSNLFNYRYDLGNLWLGVLAQLVNSGSVGNLGKLGYKVCFVNTHTICIGSSQH